VLELPTSRAMLATARPFCMCCYAQHELNTATK